MWVRGKVVGPSTKEHVVLEYGRDRLEVPRAEIRDIDHPGNVDAMIAGFLTWWWVALIGGTTHPLVQGGEPLAISVVGASVVGWTAYSLWTWDSSVRAAEFHAVDHDGTALVVAGVALLATSAFLIGRYLGNTATADYPELLSGSVLLAPGITATWMGFADWNESARRAQRIPASGSP